jgi:ABC-type cobalamin/Fe3+-siderophores transport system ATPase subunit
MHHSIHLSEVSVSISGNPVLKNVTIEAMACELAAIIGQNGAGKTTLLHVINGTVRPQTGTVTVFGHNLSTFKKLNNLRKQIAFVPQNTNHHNFPLQVKDAVLMGRYGKIGILHRPDRNDREVAQNAMTLTGILPFAEKLVSELSGGEQQKVSLARALAQEPEILLLDEPTTYLDAQSRDDIMETIHALHHQRSLTTLMVSHDAESVRQYADKVYLLMDGRTSLIT